MLVSLPGDAAAAALGSMAAVVEAARPLTDADRSALAAAHTIVFGLESSLDVDTLVRPTPAQLAVALGAGATTTTDTAADATTPAHDVVALLVVMSTVDGVDDLTSAAAVGAFARALHVHEPAVADLRRVADGHLRSARADMLRRNRRSITGDEHPHGTYGAWLMPYRDRPDPNLAARYQALGALPEHTFGGTFHRFYVEHGFEFPGEADAPTEQFTTPHDSTHVLSGYDTSVQGELLVSTFTGGMHDVDALAGHILPVIVSWHLGIGLTDLAGSTTGALDPRKFFVAWERGRAVRGDTFAASFDFWANAPLPLDEVRSRMEVPPLRTEDAADGVTPDWYEPSA